MSGSENVLCLETSFLVDYLRGENYTQEFLQDPGADEELGIPTVAVWEVYVGALLSNAPGASIAQTATALDWGDPIAFTEAAAREAAEIRIDLRERGAEIQVPDTLIAGVAKATDAELVSKDDHFGRVEGLRVRDPEE